MNDRDLELTLDHIHADLRRLPPPPELREQVRAIPATTRRRRWSLPSVPDSSLQPMLSATKLVVAGAIVALFGGFLLAGALTQPGDDTTPAAATDSTPPTEFRPAQLPPDIPDGLEWGTFDTPVGPARWVHLVGDDTSLPAAWFPGFRTPAGFVITEAITDSAEAGLEPGEARRTLWGSTDLIEWTPGVIEVEAGWDIPPHESSNWVVVDDPVALFRPTDTLRPTGTRAWERTLVDGLVPPGPDGYAWLLDPGDPVIFDEITLIPFRWTLDYGRVLSAIRGPGGRPAGRFYEGEPGVWIFSNDGGAIAAVRIEDDGAGLRIIDDADGSQLAYLEGISEEFWRSASRSGPKGYDAGAVVPGLAVSTASGFDEVPVPGELRDPWSWAVTADDDGFMSYSIGSEGQVHVHRSQDGREWVETDVIGDDPGEPTGIEGIYTSDGPVSLTNEHGDWMQRDDGEWELAWSADFDGEPLANGWLSLRNDQAVDGMWEFGPGGTIVRAWYQPRGGEPISFDISEMAIPWDLDRDCDAREAFISSNTVVTSRACGEVREAWILTFDDVPA